MPEEGLDRGRVLSCKLRKTLAGPSSEQFQVQLRNLRTNLEKQARRLELPPDIAFDTLPETIKAERDVENAIDDAAADRLTERLNK